jgi:hypothetical protein
VEASSPTSTDPAAGHRRRIGPFRSPDFAAPVLCEIDERPPGSSDDADTAQTIGYMRRYAIEDSRSPIVRRVALAATAAGGDPRQAIHRWMREHVRYAPGESFVPWRPDPAADQVLIRPVDLLTMPEPAGDCAVFSMLAAAMLRALGIECAYKTVKADPEHPEQFSHVYVMAGDLAIDGSHGPYAGWEATQGQAVTGAALWPLDEGSMHKLADVDMTGWDPEFAAQWALYNADTSGAAAGAGFDWGALLSAGVGDAAKILGTRYAVPQLSPGQTIQTGNSFMTQLPAGIASSIGSGSNLGLLLGAGALVLLAVLTLGNRRP